MTIGKMKNILIKTLYIVTCSINNEEEKPNIKYKITFLKLITLLLLSNNSSLL